MRRWVPLLALGCFAMAGCHGCRESHPYVPYRIAEGGASSGGDASEGASAHALGADSGPFSHQAATAAPAGATTWTLQGLALTAPPGFTFRQGLVWDVDGDGRDDAVVLAVGEGDGGESGPAELLLYRSTRSSPAAPEAVPIGRPAPSDPHCVRVERLARVGARSVAIEVGESCLRGTKGPAPNRTVAFVSWSGALKLQLALPIVDPVNAPVLAFDLDGADLDHDGLDDITLSVSLDGGGPPFEPRPPVHAVFRWFDRPAGMSRQPDEPDSSFRMIATAAAQRAVKVKEAAAGLALAQAGKVLFQSACSESVGRRIAPGSFGTPISCEAGRALEDLGLAEVRAYVTLGDALSAIVALDSAGTPPATRTSTRVTEATAWVTQLAPVVSATALRAIGALPLLGHDAASWGALRFEPTGTLLVRSTAGVVRVEPVQGDESEASGVNPWAAGVTSPDGRLHLLSASSPCRAADLQATFSFGSDAAVPEVVDLPIATPIVTDCPTGGSDQVSMLPVAWGASGFEAVVAGQPVLFSGLPPDKPKAAIQFQPLGQAVTPGAPRSPDGKTLVVPTSQGIVVRGASSRILRAKELDHGYLELRDCTVSDDALRVACVRGGRAFVGTWPMP